MSLTVTDATYVLSERIREESRKMMNINKRNVKDGYWNQVEESDSQIGCGCNSQNK